MRSFVRLIPAFAIMLVACQPTRQADSAASVLPLQKLRLYETGVGYFERAGKLSNGTDTLPIPASHVDDALKTLIVMGDGSGDRPTVSAIEFSSIVSRGLARSLAALPLEADRPVTYRDVLESMKGTGIELVTPEGRIAGVLVEITPAPPLLLADRRRDTEGSSDESRQLIVPDTADDHYLTILGEAGEVRRFRASRLVSVRPTDAAARDKLGSAAAALSDRAAQIRRSLRVLAESPAAVRLGYIAETPVWRSTYRLVLAPKGDHGTLQGWALIHNDTDEPWAGVSVELVNGRPDSFLFPLSAPRYARRPLAEPAELLSTVPQLADKTADQIWGDHLGGVGRGTGQGFGSGHGALGGSHRTRAPRVRMGAAHVTTSESSEISIGNLADVAQATGVETGALFSYELGKTVDLRAHGSALVPFTQGQVAARRITWFDLEAEQGRSAARIVNSTGQTLPSGPVTVYESTGFAGETGIARLKPKERAFVRFGIDLDVELHRKMWTSKDELAKLRFSDGRLREHFIRHHAAEWIFTNRSATERVVYIVLDIVKNAKVQGTDEVDFDEASDKPLAVFRIPAGKKKAREFTVDEALERSTAVSGLSAKRLHEMAGAAVLPDPTKKVLDAAAVLFEEVTKKSHEIEEADKEVERLKEDLERLRQHLAALGDKSGTPAGANPLVVRILALEDELSKLGRHIATLEDERTARTKAVEDELGKLSKV